MKVTKMEPAVVPHSQSRSYQASRSMAGSRTT